MPHVSVIIPAYNASATLKRSVESALAQDFGDFEVVIVNDGSSDDTGAVADACAVGDKRVRVLHLEKNEGAAAAMNAGWRSSGAPLVAILDADDAAKPNRLGLQVDFLASSPEISVVGGGAEFFEKDTGFRETVWMPTHHRDLRRRRWYQSPFVHPTVMMRRTFLERTGGYTAGLRLGEDYDLWMRGFQYSEIRYANLPFVFVEYTTRAVQRWRMIRASARVRHMAGKREGKRLLGMAAATRILAEGIVERSGVFSARDRIMRTLTMRGEAEAPEKRSA